MSQPKDVLDGLFEEYLGTSMPLSQLKAKIQQLYILKSDVEEAIGEDEDDQDDRFRDNQGNVSLGAHSYVQGRNQQRQEIRTTI